MKLEYFDNFVRQCPYFYGAGYSVNNDYNCAHPKQKEKDPIDTEYHKGLEVGKCYCWSCPLGMSADEEDFEKHSIDGYTWEEDGYILIDGGNKK